MDDLGASAAAGTTVDWARGLRVGVTFIGVSSLVGATLATAPLALFAQAGPVGAMTLFAWSLALAIGPAVLAGVLVGVVAAVTRRRWLLYPVGLGAGMVAPVLVHVRNEGPAPLFAVAGLLSAAVAVWAAARPAAS